MNYKEEIKAIISDNEHNVKFSNMLVSINNFVLEESKDSITSVRCILPDRITCSQSFAGCDNDGLFVLYYNWLSEEMLARIHAFILGMKTFSEFTI